MKLIKIAALALITVFVSCQSKTKASKEEATVVKETKKPNVLILLADDMGYGDIGAYGSEIETPNVNRLASEGIQYTNFHVGAACSPTRTMLMTGVDNHRAGLI